MPVVLEEFGSKLDVRNAQYKLAYDSCLTSAKRGGSCAGVMFWDLAHKVSIAFNESGCMIAGLAAPYQPNLISHPPALICFLGVIRRSHICRCFVDV